MEWFIVIGLIVLGLALIVTEIIFVPGATIVGIIGLLISSLGIYQAFVYFDTATGVTILISTLVLGVLGLILAFRAGVWDRFSLKENNIFRVNEEYPHNLEEGAKGKAISALRPMGKALFGDQEVEVRTTGQFMDSGTPIVIKKINGNSIIVETYNQI